MPYIKKERRKDLNPLMKRLKAELASANEGDLNYVITSLVHAWIQGDAENYTAYNAAIGALECAKLELYRRRVAAYEDEKIKENGDV
jgi:hypothetical protein